MSDLDEDAILAALARDKKARAGRVPFVLPTRIGEVVVEPDVTRTRSAPRCGEWAPGTAS